WSARNIISVEFNVFNIQLKTACVSKGIFPYAEGHIKPHLAVQHFVIFGKTEGNADRSGVLPILYYLKFKVLVLQYFDVFGIYLIDTEDGLRITGTKRGHLF